MRFSTITLTFALAATSVASARPLSVQERQAVEKAVREELSDSDSAKFKHPNVNFPVSAVNGIYCGYVNSKNRMGGYAGDTPFIGAFMKVRLKPLTYEGRVVEIGEESTAHLLLAMCRDKGFPMVGQ